MELRQLEMFVAIIEEGGVRAASERVSRTQPAVSVAIRKLEEEIGATLFDRSVRYDYRLTESGETLYKYAKQILGLRTEALSVITHLSNMRAGRLRIGANESISLHLFPYLAQTFLYRHPGIHIELRCARSECLLGDLKDRKLDFALISFRPQDHALASKVIAQDEVVLITNADHALSKKSSVHLRDLGKESILLMDTSEPSLLHQNIREAFARSNVPLNLKLENAPIETIKKMVAIGLGVGFVPRLSVREESARAGLCVVPLVGFRQERAIWLVRRKTVHSIAAKAFEEIASCLSEQSTLAWSDDRTGPLGAHMTVGRHG